MLKQTSIRRILALTVLLLFVLSACAKPAPATETAQPATDPPASTEPPASADVPPAAETPTMQDDAADSEEPEPDGIPIDDIPEMEVQDEYVIELAPDQVSTGW